MASNLLASDGLQVEPSHLDWGDGVVDENPSDCKLSLLGDQCHRANETRISSTSAAPAKCSTYSTIYTLKGTKGDVLSKTHQGAWKMSTSGPVL